MSFRTVVVRQRAKLDYSLGYLICRSDKETRVHLSEITCLIIESTAVSLTAALLCECCKKKVKVIFCDEQHNPCNELVGYYDNFHSSKAILQQMAWTDDAKAAVWTDIIRHKITNQAAVLTRYKLEDDLLRQYLLELQPGDSTNREGHAAKVYFNTLFGVDRRSENCVNAALNYGYAILLSAFNRAVTSMGFLTQLGIWHHNEYNYFNLSCDLMEPFRPIVDDMVRSILPLDDGFRAQLVQLTNCRITVGDKVLFWHDAIDAYARSALTALARSDARQVKYFSRYELPLYEDIGSV